MTEKQKYWLTDTSGAKALVEGADERDRWRPHGWAETDAPVAGDLVWLQHDVHGGRQLFAAAAAEQWAGLGWRPSAPPEPVDLTKDPQLVDQAAGGPRPVTVTLATVDPETGAAYSQGAQKASQKTRAASGDEKE
jgi:hypothetical protein